MKGFLVRTAITAVGLWLATVIVPGIGVAGLITLLIAAILFGVVNALIGPTLLRLTGELKGTVLIVALIVANAFLLWLTAILLPGFQVHGFIAAVLGSLVVAAVGWGASRFVANNGQIVGGRPGVIPPHG